MSFDFDKISSKHDENWWSSYADLFSMISVIFLMMYVISSMRSGIGGVQKQMQFKEIAKENADLKQQIQVYNTLKDQTLQESSDQEQQVYQGLMKKLTLLQDDARDEKDKLRKEAKDNEEKEFALNQYQQIVRNIINQNVLAKSQIKRKDTLIVTKNINLKEKEKVIENQEQDLQQSQQEISQLETSVQQKEQTINDNQQKINQVSQVLDSKIAQLRQQQQAAQISKAQLKAEIEKLTDESQQTIAQLEAKKQATQAALAQTKDNLGKVQQDLLAQQKASAEEREKLTAEMQDAQSQYQAQLGQLQAQHQAQLQAAADEKEKIKRMGARQRAAAEAKMRAEGAARDRQYQAAIGDLKGKMGDAQKALAENEAEVNNLRGRVAQTEAERGRLAAEKARLTGQLGAAGAENNRLAAEKGRLAGQLGAAGEENNRLAGETARLSGNLAAAGAEKARLAAEKERLAGNLAAESAGRAKAEATAGRALASVQNLSGELKHAQEIANAKKKLIGQIKDNLKKAGLGSEVDGKTGDVILSFGEEYFETGSAQLKPNMRGILHKFMPAYSDSLFNDPKIAEKITNVEIVGFASPTYKGRYVNPESLNPIDQEAIRYNLKLSSARAQAIFNYIFDTKKLVYQKQRDLLPKVKVVGRGYLPDGKKWSDIPKDMTEQDFCKRFNCQKAQRVLIRFNME